MDVVKDTPNRIGNISYLMVVQNQKSGCGRRLTIPLLLIFSAANKRDKPVVVLLQCRAVLLLRAPVQSLHTRKRARAQGIGGGNRARLCIKRGTFVQRIGSEEAFFSYCGNILPNSCICWAFFKILVSWYVACYSVYQIVQNQNNTVYSEIRIYILFQRCRRRENVYNKHHLSMAPPTPFPFSFSSYDDIAK